MELLIFGQAGVRILVFPTRCGRFYDYENFGLVEASREWIESGWLQLYCVDSIDQESFYCNWCRREDRIKRHVQYEEYLLREVIPLSIHRNPASPLVSHGCSLGAYHAVNIALRHPHLFSKVLALSGRYDLTTYCGIFRDLFDGYVDETIYLHMPLMYIPNINDQHYLASLCRLKITLAVGQQDPFIESNRQLSWVLHEKGILHSLHLWPGRAHNPRHWARMIHLYL
jgi:esterase/lipase superfamily enzyme